MTILVEGRFAGPFFVPEQFRPGRCYVDRDLGPASPRLDITDEWPVARTQKLIQYWEIDKLPVAEIGRKLHVSTSAAVGKAHRLGLTSRGNPVRKKAT